MSHDHDGGPEAGDWAIEWLLNLNRFRVGLDNGYWWTVRATKVEPSDGQPHGLNYSITLHNEDGKRVLGFDNSHAVDVGSGPSRKSRRPIAWDHKHEKGKEPVPYEFESPVKLIEDFLAALNAYLEKEELS